MYVLCHTHTHTHTHTHAHTRAHTHAQTHKHKHRHTHTHTQTHTHTPHLFSVSFEVGRSLFGHFCAYLLWCTTGFFWYVIGLFSDTFMRISELHAFVGYPPTPPPSPPPFPPSSSPPLFCVSQRCTPLLLPRRALLSTTFN